MPRSTLILGGVRSGKSRLAEKLAHQTNLPVLYLATALPHDQEMTTRIHNHQHHRPATWRTVEEPIALAQTLTREARPHQCIIVECLTLWLTNLLPNPGLLKQESANLLATIPTLPGEILLVGNETNLGIIPIDAITRQYVDAAGQLHQNLAQLCTRVILTVAGLPLTLKGDPS